MSSDHLPILIGLQTTATSSHARQRTYINLKKADWTQYRQEMSSHHLPTDCQKDEKLFRTTLLKAASHHIPTGIRKLYTQHVPAEILAILSCRQWHHNSRPMKETLHSRHHSTVLPRLGASKKESLKNLHTPIRFGCSSHRQQPSTE